MVAISEAKSLRETKNPQRISEDFFFPQIFKKWQNYAMTVMRSSQKEQHTVSPFNANTSKAPGSEIDEKQLNEKD